MESRKAKTNENAGHLFSSCSSSTQQQMQKNFVSRRLDHRRPLKPNRRPFPGPPPSSLPTSSGTSSSSSSSPHSSDSWSSFWSEKALSTSLADLFLADERPQRVHGTVSSSSTSSGSRSHQSSAQNIASAHVDRETRKSEKQEPGSTENDAEGNERCKVQNGAEGKHELPLLPFPVQPNTRRGLQSVSGNSPFLHALLSKSAYSMPALFGFPIELATGNVVNEADGDRQKNSRENSGNGLVRRRSFSRKSMLVPDRVPAFQRQSMALRRLPILRRRTKKQQEVKPHRLLPSVVSTKKVPTPTTKNDGEKVKKKKKAVAVDWTGVPRLIGGAQNARGRANNGKQWKRTGGAIKKGNGRSRVLSLARGAKKAAIVRMLGSSRTAPTKVLGKAEANGGRRSRVLGCRANSRRGEQSLIQPVDLSKTGKGRVLRRTKNGGGKTPRIAEPPNYRQFIVGKAPELFSKPVFLNSIRTVEKSK